MIRPALAALILLSAGSEARAAAPPGGVNDAVAAAVEELEGGDLAGGRGKLEQFAKAGDADAAEALGEFYNFGIAGFARDRKVACGYFAMGSGKRGDTTHNDALCHEDGTLGAVDLPGAAVLYRKAADLGFAKAKCALGNFYMDGRGVAQDKPRGLALCKEAAEAGVADAQTDVGDVYLTGNGVLRDAVEARRWYERATAQNQRNAAFTLGEIYWNGDGVAKDNATATKYWRIAYENGRKDAAKMLGDEAFVRARLPTKAWSLAGLDEARAWYEKGQDAETPQIRGEAAERAQLMQQLRAVMQRKGQTS